MPLTIEITNPEVIANLLRYFNKMKFNLPGGITKKLHSLNWTRDSELELVIGSGKETEEQKLVFKVKQTEFTKRHKRREGK